MIPKTIIDQFSHKTILVVGDIMLDRYIYGTVDRISPEAPIPIVAWHETMIVPGGAGNTAANITALGAKCHLIGVLGEDRTAEELKQALDSHSISIDNLVADARPTTEKTRVLGNHQQIVRIDHEVTRPVSETEIETICQNIQTMARQCDAIIVCDYAKGVVVKAVIECLRAMANKYALPILADVRPEHKSLYHNLSFITPNKKELSAMVGLPIGSLDSAKDYGLRLAQELKTNILLTMSEDGMLLIDYKTQKFLHLPTHAQEVIDVSGAGDTVIASMALALAAGADNTQAAEIATHAASIVVAKLGTATTSTAELLETFTA